jgi:hypothetical protein
MEYTLFLHLHCQKSARPLPGQKWKYFLVNHSKHKVPSLRLHSQTPTLANYIVSIIFVGQHIDKKRASMLNAPTQLALSPLPVVPLASLPLRAGAEHVDLA